MQKFRARRAGAWASGWRSKSADGCALEHRVIAELLARTGTENGADLRKRMPMCKADRLGSPFLHLMKFRAACACTILRDAF